MSIRTFLLLYVTHEEVIAFPHHENAKLLAEWLGADTQDGPHSGRTYPLALAPDICAACGYMFGYTTSGRIRLGCPGCGGIPRSIHWYHVQELATILHMTQEWVVYYLSQALHRAFHTKEHHHGRVNHSPKS